MKTPEIVALSEHEASSMAALGAAALAHSASTIASLSAAATTPGSVQLQLPPSQVVEVSLAPGCGWTCVKKPLG
ncbi:MAG: hypothetical protein ACLPXZ_29835 [Mycobacterium sp.]